MTTDLEGRSKAAMRPDLAVAWECNLFRACAPFLKHIGKVMLLVLLGLAGGIYGSVVSNALLPALRAAGPLGRLGWGLCLLLYTALVTMLLWSYFASFLSDPGTVPPGWHPFGDDEEAEREALALEEERGNPLGPWRPGAAGSAASWQRAQQEKGVAYEDAAAAGRAFLERPRFCKKCRVWKPPRAHHCSMSGACVLRMDHYCVWVLNCVGLLNYKHFLLFLAYTFLACAASTALLLRPCIRHFADGGEGSVGGLISSFLTFVFSIAFTLALLGFLIMHARLVACNQTTIEAYEKRVVKPWPYDRGARRNFLEIFGRERWRWALPTHTREHVRDLLDTALRRPDAGQSAALLAAGGGSIV